MLADWLVSCYDYSGNVNRASCLIRPMFVGYLWWLFEAESQHRKTTAEQIRYKFEAIVRKVTSYQAMSALTVQKLARFRCSHGSARFRTVPFKYFHLFFSGKKFAHLAVQKLAQFHRTRVNATRNCAKICPCKNALNTGLGDWVERVTGVTP